MVHNTTHKWYYTITNIKTEKKEISNAKWNRFKVVNNYGQLGKLTVSVFRTKKIKDIEIPVDIELKDYYNLYLGVVINFDPSAELTYASILVYKNWPQPLPDASKIWVPLGKWHQATIYGTPGTPPKIDLS